MGKERVKSNSDVLSHIINLDKTPILQEAKQCFKTPSIKTKRLVDILTKCIHIQFAGEKLTNAEATELFFHITQLFQHKDKDTTLRRLIYIGIRALSEKAQNAYIVTSSLINDVNSLKDDPAVRAAALRALCQISDIPNNISIEQCLRQSLSDKHRVIATAALTSLIRIAEINIEIVNRFTAEIQDALKSDLPMVQYHALVLRYMMCRDNRLATSQLLTTCVNQGFNSSLAICLLIRLLCKFMIDENLSCDESKRYVDCIRNCLNDKSDMIEYEAAVALLQLAKHRPEQYKNEESQAISKLRNFLTSPTPALRYTALRLLNELSAQSLDKRFWSIHRIGSLCKLHLLTKRYRPGDDIIGVLDFTESKVLCIKYCCVLQCEETEQFEQKNEFSIGFKKNDFTLTIPQRIGTSEPVLHFVLSFLFYIANKDYQKVLFEDRAGTIELPPDELDTKLFSCDFPILVHNDNYHNYNSSMDLKH